jgi:hypothetical protein
MVELTGKKSMQLGRGEGGTQTNKEAGDLISLTFFLIKGARNIKKYIWH